MDSTGVNRTGLDSDGNLWEIYQTDDGRWKWKKYKGCNDKEVTKESEESFNTEKDCEANSRDHGMDEEYGGLLGTGDTVRD